MKAILEFNLPEEQTKHLTAVHAGGLASMLWDLDQWLRGELKYKDLDEKTDAAYDTIRGLLRDYADNHGVPWEEIIG